MPNNCLYDNEPILSQMAPANLHHLSLARLCLNQFHSIQNKVPDFGRSITHLSLDDLWGFSDDHELLELICAHFRALKSIRLQVTVSVRLRIK